jgi:hypothetical protein
LQKAHVGKRKRGSSTVNAGSSTVNAAAVKRQRLRTPSSDGAVDIGSSSSVGPSASASSDVVAGAPAASRGAGARGFALGNRWWRSPISAWYRRKQNLLRGQVSDLIKAIDQPIPRSDRTRAQIKRHPGPVTPLLLAALLHMYRGEYYAEWLAPVDEKGEVDLLKVIFDELAPERLQNNELLPEELKTRLQSVAGKIRVSKNRQKAALCLIAHLPSQPPTDAGLKTDHKSGAGLTEDHKNDHKSKTSVQRNSTGAGGVKEDYRLINSFQHNDVAAAARNAAAGARNDTVAGLGNDADVGAGAGVGGSAGVLAMAKTKVDAAQLKANAKGPAEVKDVCVRSKPYAIRKSELICVECGKGSECRCLCNQCHTPQPWYQTLLLADDAPTFFPACRLDAALLARHALSPNPNEYTL